MSDLIGPDLARIEGPAKLTGNARYAAEIPIKGLAYAALVQSTIAAGRIRSVDARQALAAAGVIAVMTHENAPRLDRTAESPQITMFPLLQDDRVLFNGQHVALVIAESFEQATHAATLLAIDYERQPAIAVMPDRPDAASQETPKHFRNGERPPDSDRGDAPAALGTAAVTVDAVYTTPVEHHNPMEPHATIAAWDGDALILYNATQAVSSNQQALAKMFGLPPAKVRVISSYVGGGFGCKGATWPHIPLAAMAARMVGRPVKLVLTRRNMFTSNGYRPRTVQRVALGAAQDGKLQAILHEGVTQNSAYGEFAEPVGLASEMLYSCPNVHVTHRLTKVNAGLPTYMRAPGEASGVYALECAMDELAYALQMDPVALRLANHADRDEHQDLPWSSKSLRQCYEQGAAAFGWDKRSPKPGLQRDGALLIGMGMATATYPTNRSKAGALARLLANGQVVVQCGSQEIGGGTYTIMAQTAADTLGLPIARVRAELGDSSMPPAPVSGGSQTTASIQPAVQAACRALLAKAIDLAAQDPASPLAGAAPDSVTAGDGRLFLRSDPGRGVSFQDLLRRAGRSTLEARADSDPGDIKKRYSMHAFGAQFAEVAVDPELGEIRLRRYTGVFAAGRILNAKTARSQMIGGIVYGMGMALLEHSEVDPRTGRIANASLADYLVPVHADVPPIDIHFVPEQDDIVNPLGAKGIGELPMVGVAAAIANAVYHATGKRIRDLPLTVDKLLA
jgi:xanthine dehydrogenase YagR molybdenum-binding subunit